MSVARNITVILSVGITVGARFPAASTATGRVLLAAQPPETWADMIKELPLPKLTDRTVTERAEFRKILKDVREKGWCLVDQELEIGLTSIAVPVYSRSGALAGAINVGAPSTRMSPEAMVETVLPKLQETVANVSRAIAR